MSAIYFFCSRMELIQIYCKSVNRESVPNSIRIRPKTINNLISIVSESSLKKAKRNNTYISTLPLIGYNTFSEAFDVNSLLLLKTNDNQSFHSTYVLRVQIFINSTEDENEETFLTLENIINEIRQK
ncbi:hypothetical protein NQ314_019783 [Rhamnusium bicolor]|uniref:Uncharacterized protein n=1 Tax=Rhamnusium bicolor TaxID=1586634 RepID=A0AAV8WMA5_9CUCU|nr:hypothetical protein NQ314_019783 [Rhamnusium bicolor]